jgi:hypothetical protein
VSFQVELPAQRRDLSGNNQATTPIFDIMRPSPENVTPIRRGRVFSPQALLIRSYRFQDQEHDRFTSCRTLIQQLTSATCRFT